MNFFEATGPWAWAIAVILAIVVLILIFIIRSVEKQLLRTIERRDRDQRYHDEERAQNRKLFREDTDRLLAEINALHYFAPQIKRAFRTKDNWDGKKRYDPAFLIEMHKVALSNDKGIKNFTRLQNAKNVLSIPNNPTN